jgi:hypothetical protein
VNKGLGGVEGVYLNVGAIVPGGPMPTQGDRLQTFLVLARVSRVSPTVWMPVMM